MPSTATVTAKYSIGLTATAIVIRNVIRLELDTEIEVIRFFTNDGAPPREFDVSAATTWTLTVSGNTYTLTIS